MQISALKIKSSMCKCIGILIENTGHDDNVNGGRTLSKKFRNKYIKGSVRFLVKTQKHPGAPWVKTEAKKTLQKI